MKFRPLRDHVLIRRVEQEAKTTGGILIPNTAQEKPMEGEVLAVGPGAHGDDGKVHPLDIKPNNRVLFGKWSGTEIRLDGEDLMIMRESDIMGIVTGGRPCEHARRASAPGGSEPVLAGEAVLLDRAPEDQDVHTRVGAAGRGVARQAERRLDGAPRLRPGQAALLELADDLVRDLLIERGAVARRGRRRICALAPGGAWAVSAAGGRKPLSRLSRPSPIPHRPFPLPFRRSRPDPGTTER